MHKEDFLKKIHGLTIVLGSSSIFRKKILTDTGLPFEVIEPDIDEKNIRTGDFMHTPLIISYAKAKAIEQKITKPSFVITCDQMIICNRKLLEKPEDAAQVREWFKKYKECPVWYVNGVTLHSTVTGKYFTAGEITTSVFSEIPEAVAEEEIQKGEVFTCCGALSALCGQFFIM